LSEGGEKPPARRVPDALQALESALALLPGPVVPVADHGAGAGWRGDGKEGTGRVAKTN